MLHKVQVIFGAEFVQLAQLRKKRHAAALGVTAKGKEGFAPS